MAQYHRLAVVNILSFKSFISESCPLFLELLSFKSFEAECDACNSIIYISYKLGDEEDMYSNLVGNKENSHYRFEFIILYIKLMI